MPEHDTTANAQRLDDPEALFERDDVTTEIVEVEADAEAFERHRDWNGLAIAGITNDDGEVLLVKNTDPDVCHDWVLPHGAVREADVDWAETAADWVDGLTGVSATIEDVVHVRRNDITHDPAEGETQETTSYHVVFSGRPHAGESIQADVRYDCDDVWLADWHESIPDSARETESQDIALFVD